MPGNKIPPQKKIEIMPQSKPEPKPEEKTWDFEFITIENKRGETAIKEGMLVFHDLKQSMKTKFGAFPHITNIGYSPRTKKLLSTPFKKHVEGECNFRKVRNTQTIKVEFNDTYIKENPDIFLKE